MFNIRKKIIFLLVSSLMILSLLACSSEETQIPTPTPTLIPAEDEMDEGVTCTLNGGEVVQKGWSGKDTGANYCNQCMCLNVGLACTKMACPPVKLPVSPTPTPTQVPPTPTATLVTTPASELVTKEVEKVVEKVPATLLPSFEILNKHPKLDCLNKTMDVFIDIFGIWVISTKSAPENYVLHTANVLAEFIDNDLDGIPDDADVLKYLVENNYVVPVWTTSIRTDFWKQARGTYCEDNIGMAASMYYDEDQWALGGIKKTGTWDGNLEEVWHVISRGWYGTYPQAFGNQDDINDTSRLREAMDTARGGKFDIVPSKYPDDAWYKYYDSTCEYHCQVSEYFYWALMSNIGALEPTLTNKCEESKHEWNICTKSDLQKIDKSVYALLNDSTFRLPKNIPLGRYIIQK